MHALKRDAMGVGLAAAALLSLAATVALAPLLLIAGLFLVADDEY